MRMERAREKEPRQGHMRPGLLRARTPPAEIQAAVRVRHYSIGLIAHRTAVAY